MNPYEYTAQPFTESPKQHAHVPFPGPTASIKGDDFDFSDASLPTPLESEQRESLPPPRVSSVSPDAYVEPIPNSMHGYTMYPNTQQVFSPVFVPTGNSYPAPVLPPNYIEPTTQSNDTPLVAPAQTAETAGHLPPSLPPSPPIPTIYTPEAIAQARSNIRAKKRTYDEEDEDAGRARRGRGHQTNRRSHQMFSRHMGKSLSNEEEYELMDFTLMKKIEELNALREALDTQLISKESFEQKQTQFLESFPFE